MAPVISFTDQSEKEIKELTFDPVRQSLVAVQVYYLNRGADVQRCPAKVAMKLEKNPLRGGKLVKRKTSKPPN